jgi:hypothetical protein
MGKLTTRFKKMLGNVTNLIELVGLWTLVAIGLTLPADLSFPAIQTYISNPPKLAQALTISWQRAPAALLSITTVCWYYLYKGAVLNEIDLVDEMFSDSNKPEHFGSLIGHEKIYVLAYIIVATFILLILTVTRIQIYCLIALVLHTSDLIGQGLVAQNINKMMNYFRVADGPDAEYTLEIREIMRKYYYDNPTMFRICIILLGTSISLVVSSNVDEQSPYHLYYLPYMLMMANIIIGELTIKSWRVRRDRALEEVARRKDANSVGGSAAQL